MSKALTGSEYLSLEEGLGGEEGGETGSGCKINFKLKNIKKNSISI